MDRKSIEKRLQKLEDNKSSCFIKGIMPDGETYLFDVRTALVLSFNATIIRFKQNRAPNSKDFLPEDPIFMQNFIKAELPHYPYIPMMRQAFKMTIDADLAVHEIPLGYFMDLIL
jgi:hypothetical protein